MVVREYWDEEWARVDFQGIDEEMAYEISNYGRIRHHVNGAEWMILKPSNQKKDGSGYEYFRFKGEHGKLMTKAVHRIVGMAFCPIKHDEQKFVLHIDFNKSNNYYGNLIWASRAELVAHNTKNPRVIAGHARTKGLIRRSKLTETEVIRLKIKLKRGKNKLYKIAKEFGITHTQLNRIRSGENWGHVKIDD